MDTDTNNALTMDELVSFCVLTGTQPEYQQEEEKKQQQNKKNNNLCPVESLSNLMTMCATIHHLDSETLCDIRAKMVAIGTQHATIMNNTMTQNVDVHKIKQFTTSTRGELLSSLIKPPCKYIA